MTSLHLNHDASDDEIIAAIDDWASRLEADDYAGALALISQPATSEWTADLMRRVIKAYGRANPDQKVTVASGPSDVAPRKIVERWADEATGCGGYVWYDLNIDGAVSDLTAQFDILFVECGLFLRLSDIHVM